MAARTSGSKLVGAAVALTAAAVGVGTIYLPFYADKDRLRGLHEESDLTTAEREEYERVMDQLRKERGKDATNSNSMWSRMNDQAEGGKK